MLDRGLFSSIGFAVNLNVLKPRSSQHVGMISVSRLARNKYGKLVSSGTGYTVLATRTDDGRDQAIEYLKALDSNILDYTRSGAMPGKLVGLANSWNLVFHDVLAFRQQGRFDLVFPREGTGFEIGGIAIVKHKSSTRLKDSWTSC